MGHYRLIHGYDNLSGNFALRDSLEPAGYRMDYVRFDLLWRVFNRRMLVIYRPERYGGALTLAGSGGTGDSALQLSLITASVETRASSGLPEEAEASKFRALEINPD